MEQLIEKKREAQIIKAYKSSQKIHIMTSRFNNATMRENAVFREKNWKTGCMYCTPAKVSQSIPIDSKMFVLEMNNETNQIFGIGLCLNRSFIERYSVYDDNNFNRYNYVGKYRIARSELDAEEEAVFKALDMLCFKGSDHMKRGHGLRAFPPKLLYKCHDVFNIPEFIENMFVSRYKK